MAKLLPQSELPDETFLKRTDALQWAIGLGFLIIISRLWSLQIMAEKEYELLSRHNRIEPVPIVAPRGKILDRTGRIVATTRPCFTVTAIPDQMDDAAVGRLAERLGLTEKALRDRLETHRSAKDDEVVVAENAPWETVVEIEEIPERFHGVRIDVRHRRHYPYDEATSHLLGYVGNVSEEEFARLPAGVYRKTDFVGKDGIERTYEARLKGADGVKFYEVDARRRRIRQASRPPAQPPVPGDDLVLTLDLSLQLAAHRALGEEAGAIVAMDPRSGEIRCLVSHPAYDPNLLLPPTRSDQVNDLFSRADHPILNRAVNSAYSPGSTFKPVVAAAGLAEDKIKSSSELTCRGHIQLGTRKFHCWRKHSHGPLCVHEALRQSCNVFFYQLGLRLGARKIDEFSSQFGLGRKTGIMLPAERAGVVPSTLWRNPRSPSWYKGDTVNLSIGQGYLLTTPLQVACMYSVIASDGILFKPSLVKYAVPSAGDVFQEFTPEIRDRIDLAGRDFDAIKLGLWEVVNHPRGTGKNCRMAFPEIAGKTGTVQVVSGMSETELPKHLRDHAWFVAMAPAEAPEMVLVVFVEHGGKGGEIAAPIAREILESYFGEETSEPLDGEQHL